MPESNLTVSHSFPIWLPQTQTWMYNQIAELQSLGVDTHVVCEHTENLDQFVVTNIHSLSEEPKWRQISDKGLRKLRLRRHLSHLVRSGRHVGTNIIHSHFGNVGWADLGAVRRLGARHAVTFYGIDVNKLPLQRPKWRQRYKMLFSAADLFLCEGTHMGQCLVGLGCPPDKVAVQHLGVDVDNIAFSPRQWQASAPLRVLIAASFREKKGIPFALEALARLREDVQMEVTIIGDAGGDAESVEQKALIMETLDRTGLRPVARLLGYQPHKRMLDEAYKHHFFLHPSVTAEDGDTEGGAPVSIIEMLATGMPVVSTEHCDIPEVVGPKLRHFLAPERDVPALVERMRMLINAPERWAEWSAEGRKHVEAEYHKTRQAVRLRAHYDALVNR